MLIEININNILLLNKSNNYYICLNNNKYD